MPSYVVGVDFGTESGRAVVIDTADGRELGSSVYRYANGVIDEHLPAPDEDERDWHERTRDMKGAVDNYRLDRLRSSAESVYLGRFLTERRENKRAVTYIPVEAIQELKEPGIYIAVMSQPGRFRYDYQTTYFYVSDLGLHARLFDRSADAYVSSLTDGRAVARVEISWLDAQGKVLARAVTDADGRASFAERLKDAKVLLARAGGNRGSVSSGGRRIWTRHSEG